MVVSRAYIDFFKIRCCFG